MATALEKDTVYLATESDYDIFSDHELEAIECPLSKRKQSFTAGIKRMVRTVGGGFIHWASSLPAAVLPQGRYLYAQSTEIFIVQQVWGKSV